MAALAKILVKFGADIADISHRLNYTRFYSLLGLTSYVPGWKLYTHYMSAKLRRRGHEIMPYMEDSFVDQEALWMFSVESCRDDDFSVLTQTSCGAPLRTSKNIQIFGGQQHSISVNNIPLKNRLVLSVPTDEAPDRIDDAIRQFRAALMEELIGNCGGYFNVGTDDYSISIFMTQFAHEACLIKDWDQVQRHIIGLWCWDIACKNGNSIASASDKIVEKLKKIKTEFGHGLPLYPVDTIHRCYESTSKVIGPRTRKKLLKPTQIDLFVTRSADILGAIGDPAV